VSDYHELANSFHARDIAVPMALAYAVDIRASAADAHLQLRQRNFDQAPVIRDGAIAGYVLTDRLLDHATVSQALRPISEDCLVSSDASVAKLLDWMVMPGFLFVLDGHRIMGFVTVHDFNKQPSRAYFYLLVVSVELAIAEHLRARYRLEQHRIFDIAGPTAQRAKRRYEADVRDNVDADPISYLGFRPLLTAFAHDDHDLRAIGMRADEWRVEQESLIGLRNAVMHPTVNLLVGKGGLVDLRQKRQRLLTISERLSEQLTNAR
jgi:hypothetical protein